eukprot:323697-Chlamydomonas_euryale.AAC.11
MAGVCRLPSSRGNHRHTSKSTLALEHRCGRSCARARTLGVPDPQSLSAHGESSAVLTGWRGGARCLRAYRN